MLVGSWWALQLVFAESWRGLCDGNSERRSYLFSVMSSRYRVGTCIACPTGIDVLNNNSFALHLL